MKWKTIYRKKVPENCLNILNLKVYIFMRKNRFVFQIEIWKRLFSRFNIRYFEFKKKI